MKRLLLIDDEPDVLLALVRRTVGQLVDEVNVARSGADGLVLAKSLHPDLILLDLGLPDQSGLDVFAQLRELDSRCPVVFLTASETTESAIEAMKQGAFDYLFKPADVTQLRQVITAALEVSRVARTPTVMLEHPATDSLADAMIGRCPAMREIYKEIGRVAPRNVTVLIQGESGTGKELVARSIYQHSTRNNKPFIAINSAAIPDTLLESELFGHEKGAFTGADRRRIGKFEQANGGTLFLDEIGDMPLLTQAKLLRVLQDQRFERVGGNETIQTDVRIIAATHHDLEALVQAKRFRADLYYRLSVFTIRLPPLRERLQDLPVLVQHYVNRFARELGSAIQEVAPETLELLKAYPWPGNIRELQSILKQAILRSAGPVLLPSFLPESFLPERRPTGALPASGAGPASGASPTSGANPASSEPTSSASVVGGLASGPADGASSAAIIDDPPVPPPSAAPREAEADPLVQLIRQRLAANSHELRDEVFAYVDRILLPMVLRHTGGSQVKAAEILGITRRTLRTRLRELGITITRSIESEPDEE